MNIEDAVLQIRTHTVPTEDTEMVELKISKADYDAFETITKALSNGYRTGSAHPILRSAYLQQKQHGSRSPVIPRN